MASISERRKKAEDYIYKVMNILDPSGANAKIYKNRFSSMTDSEFDKYMKDFLNNDDKQFYLEIIEYERDLTLENIMKCADFMKVPLMERIAIPYVTGDKETVVVTPYPVPVGYIHEKRLQQTLMKKSAGSTKIDERSALTGQVVGHDKNARNSDLETYSLATVGANEALREFFGPRADNVYAKRQMISDIQKNGYVSLGDLELRDPYNKISLNTFNTYYYLQGLSTNLITKLDTIPGPRKKE